VTSDGKSSRPVETTESGTRNKPDADVPMRDAKTKKATPPVMVGSAECAGREPGDLYCDDQANMHVCLSARLRVRCRAASWNTALVVSAVRAAAVFQGPCFRILSA